MLSSQDIQNLIASDISSACAAFATVAQHAANLEAAALACIECLETGGKIVFFGNGGSAADAQHMAAEFTGRFMLERKALPAIALTTNTSSLTAIGNDYSYDSVFERQVEALVHSGDVVVGFSTSGNSENVLRGIAKAKSLGAKTIGFSGKQGRLKEEVDMAFAVDSVDTPRIQECHVLLCHTLTHIVETSMFG